MIRFSGIATIMALVSAAIGGFRPSHLTELLLWVACIMFVYERDHAR